MKTTSFVAHGLAFVVAISTVAFVEAREPNTALRGEWELVVAFHDGKMDLEMVGSRETFGNGNIDGPLLRWSGQETVTDNFLEYSLKPTLSPQEIDLVIVERLTNSKGKQTEKRLPLAKGIFVVKKDVLVCCIRICYDDESVKRPRSFSTESPNWFFVYKKRPPRKSDLQEAEKCETEEAADSGCP